jgi:hypothetical protein
MKAPPLPPGAAVPFSGKVPDNALEKLIEYAHMLARQITADHFNDAVNELHVKLGDDVTARRRDRKAGGARATSARDTASGSAETSIP